MEASLFAQVDVSVAPLLLQAKDIGGISTRVCEGAGRSGDLVPLTKQRVRRRVRLGELVHLRQLVAFGDLKASGLMPGGLKKGACDHFGPVIK